MLLTYSLDRFVESIKTGTKKHTIREDPKRRWKAGMKIHHWRGNPRNVRSNPYQFAEGECNGVQELMMERIDITTIAVFIFKHHNNGKSIVELMEKHTENDGRFLSRSEVELLAKNDDLPIEVFQDWFTSYKKRTFIGRIIHFTDLRY